MFFSVFGQSVFFGVYLPMIQEELALSKTEIGIYYAIATIASAITIIFTGKGLDHFPLRNFVAMVFCGLAVGCFLMAHAHSAFMLLLAFFLLRQFGQGLTVLSAGTSINRYLTHHRGKAVALVNLGGSFHIMIFPVLAITLSEIFYWRDMWNFYGLFILFFLLPLFWFYLRSHQSKTHEHWQARIKTENEMPSANRQEQWTRKRVLMNWRFYGIVSIAVISSFAGTAVFFYQRELADSLDMSAVAFASSFIFYTVATIFASLSAGTVIDKYGEKPALIAFPIFYTIGLLLLIFGPHIIFLYAGMICLGAGTATIATTGGPLLTKLYGSQYLGSVKSLLFSANILSSALSPFIFGFFLDRGVEITTLFLSVTFYSGFIWLLAFPICAETKPARRIVTS